MHAFKIKIKMNPPDSCLALKRDANKGRAPKRSPFIVASDEDSALVRH